MKGVMVNVRNAITIHLLVYCILSLHKHVLSSMYNEMGLNVWIFLICMNMQVYTSSALHIYVCVFCKPAQYVNVLLYNLAAHFCLPYYYTHEYYSNLKLLFWVLYHFFYMDNCTTMFYTNYDSGLHACVVLICYTHSCTTLTQFMCTNEYPILYFTAFVQYSIELLYNTFVYFPLPLHVQGHYTYLISSHMSITMLLCTRMCTTTISTHMCITTN